MYRLGVDNRPSGLRLFALYLSALAGEATPVNSSTRELCRFIDGLDQ